MDSEAEVEVEALVGEVVVEEEVEEAEEGDLEGEGVEADSRGTQVEDAVFVRIEICSHHW